MSLERMMEATRGFPDQLVQAEDVVDQVDLPRGSFDDVVVVGMGGSSFGGALAVACLEPEATLPMGVVRDHHPPGSVDEGTLAVATSYSGNTTETLDATRACRDAGATLVAVTTGGKLGPLVEDAGGTVIEVPEGFQPRAAVGWLFGTNHAILTRALDLDAHGALTSAAKRLEERVDPLAEAGGIADEIAAGLGEGPIGVVGHDVMGTVARRWAGEIAENGKQLAFHAVLPEMVHNQIVGWDGAPGDATLVVLRRQEEGALEQARLGFLAERAAAAGADVLEARIPATGLDATLEGVLLGDLVSLHLARRDGIDPEPVDVIDALKERLAENG